jgi:hypothetical protein
MIDWAEVLLIAPELVSLSQAQQTFILAQVEPLDVAVWGDKLSLAQCYLAASIGSASTSSHNGPIKSETLQGNSGSHTREYWTSGFGVGPGNYYWEAFVRLARSVSKCRLVMA